MAGPLTGMLAAAVQERASAGRTLVTKDAIPAGDIALTDLPFAIAVHKRRRQQVTAVPVVQLPSAMLSSTGWAALRNVHT